MRRRRILFIVFERTRVGDVAWTTVAEVVQRVQQDLDRSWELDELAHLAGYELHHFAHVFRSVVGVSPRHYVRRLRLERAAYDLLSAGDDIGAVASRAGYQSGEAFARAFRRAFRVAPTEFRARSTKQVDLPPEAPGAADASFPDLPKGLSPGRPEIVSIGPLRAWSVVMESFDDMNAVQAALMQLAAAKPPDGPFQLGGVSLPWGWLSGDVRRELRCIRVVDEGEARPPPPLMPWRLPRGWFARFDYHGPLDRVADVCAWIMASWIPRSGLRSAFAPLFSLLGMMDGDGGAHVLLHAPIRPIRSAA